MPAIAVRKQQPGTQRVQHFPPLDRHRLRHGQGDLIPARRRHVCQCDACVSAGGLDDFFTGLQNSALLRVPDHGGPDPVLHRISRVAPFDLGQQGYRSAIR